MATTNPPRHSSAWRRFAVLAFITMAALTIGTVRCHAAVEVNAAPTDANTAPADTSLLNLAEFRGQVVYLDFWASWCAPCKHSFPWMKRMQDTYGAKGLHIIAVNLDRDPKTAEEFLAANAPSFKILRDPKGRLARAYDIEAMPSSFLYDRSGKQRSAHLGFKTTDESTLEREIIALLAEAAPDTTRR